MNVFAGSAVLLASTNLNPLRSFPLKIGTKPSSAAAAYDNAAARMPTAVKIPKTRRFITMLLWRKYSAAFGHRGQMRQQPDCKGVTRAKQEFRGRNQPRNSGIWGDFS